jgi:hypothetical protein
MATYTDDFNRSPPLGANWTQVGGGPTISSNQVVFYTGPLHQAYWNGAVGEDQYSEADIAGGGAGGVDAAAAPATRVLDHDNMYYAWVSNTGSGPFVALWVINANSYAQIGGPVSITSTTCRCRLESQGSTHRVYIDGVLKLTVVNSARTGGRPGFVGFTTAATITLDNWEGGDYVPPPAAYPGAAPVIVGQNAPITRSFNW